VQLRPWHNVFRCHSRENRDFKAAHHFTFGTNDPTPTLALPLMGRGIVMLLPLQGGGQEGDGVSVGMPLVSSPPFTGKDQLDGKGGGTMKEWNYKKTHQLI